jgi:hypothetical protein
MAQKLHCAVSRWDVENFNRTKIPVPLEPGTNKQELFPCGVVT